MKLRQMISSKKVQATATRRTNASTRAANMEEEESEPTIRFSTAFVVVLLLHMVAFGGVYTFDALKVNRSSKSAASAEEAKKDAEELAPVSPAAALAVAGQTAPVETPKTAQPVAPPAAVQKQEATATQAASATKAPAKTAAVSASATVHVVKKGENPVGIAKHYGVDYETLLSLNKIDDPRRLRIGQKLQIPVK